MDQDETFYQQPIDRTPYSAFVWVIGMAIIITALLGYGVWRAGSWAKSKRFLEASNQTGATDALLNQVQQAGSSALDQAKTAAEQSASKAANDAAAAATQQLLQQENAAIKSGSDAAQTQIKTQADEQYQQLLNK